MSETDPNLTPLADCVPADVYYCLVYKLRDVLPTPPNPSPQYLTRRDNALVGRLAALRCLRTALRPETSAEWVLKNRAQANATKRQAYAALTRLERMQAERRKLEKDPETGRRRKSVQIKSLAWSGPAVSKDGSKFAMGGVSAE
jgi:hypothetical protein